MTDTLRSTDVELPLYRYASRVASAGAPPRNRRRLPPSCAMHQGQECAPSSSCWSIYLVCKTAAGGMRPLLSSHSLRLGVSPAVELRFHSAPPGPLTVVRRVPHRVHRHCFSHDVPCTLRLRRRLLATGASPLCNIDFGRCSTLTALVDRRTGPSRRQNSAPDCRTGPSAGRQYRVLGASPATWPTVDNFVTHLCRSLCSPQSPLRYAARSAVFDRAAGQPQRVDRVHTPQLQTAGYTRPTGSALCLWPSARGCLRPRPLGTSALYIPPLTSCSAALCAYGPRRDLGAIRHRRPSTSQPRLFSAHYAPPPLLYKRMWTP